MKKITAFLSVLCLCCALFAGCAAAPKASEQAQDPEASMDTGYVSFSDGEYWNYPVSAYGKPFTLPEPVGEDSEGEFRGWVSTSGLYQPGDTVIAEEFMDFTALRAYPDMGTVLMLDTVRGGYSMLSSEEEMELYCPSEDYTYEDYDDFFDHWEDENGNTYTGKDSVSVAKGEVLILTAVYSKDYSAAYKVDIYTNTGDDFFNMEFHRYVKMGDATVLFLVAESEGMHFEGWYDAPEGGHYIAGEDELFTPTGDISIYGHWVKE